MCLDIRQINIIIYFLNFYLFYCYFILFYELNCKSAQALDMDLQSALSFMDSNNILLKTQKDFNKSVALFKKDSVALFKNNKARFNDVIFMRKYTRLAV